MTDVHYGVVHQDGVWKIIGAGLRYGAYRSRRAAVRAAQRLAARCAGLRVHLHVQDEAGRLAAPRRAV